MSHTPPPEAHGRSPVESHDDVVRLDSDRLKALAHPTRARLLAMLRSDGPATASQLAAVLDTNSGQTSYHLRTLADADLIEEEPSRGTARERYWRARHRSTRIDTVDFDADPGDRERLRWLLQMGADLQDRLYRRWLEDMHDYDAAWRDAADMSDFQLRLTPDQLAAMSDDLAAVIARYTDAEPGPDPADDAERVMVLLRAFPVRDLDV